MTRPYLVKSFHLEKLKGSQGDAPSGFVTLQPLSHMGYLPRHTVYSSPNALTVRAVHPSSRTAARGKGSTPSATAPGSLPLVIASTRPGASAPAAKHGRLSSDNYN